LGVIDLTNGDMPIFLTLAALSLDVGAGAFLAQMITYQSLL
jgi:hypothetical protein